MMDTHVVDDIASRRDKEGHMTDLQREVEQIAMVLHEVHFPPKKQIERALQTLGVERTWRFVFDAMTLEAAGGMLTPDGSRRRTLGGVFFQLIRDSVPDDQRAFIFTPSPQQKQLGPTKPSQQKQLGPTKPSQQKQPESTKPPQPPRVSSFWLSGAKLTDPRWRTRDQEPRKAKRR